MVLKRRFSFWWRLFVPIVALSWLLVGFLMAYAYKSEKDFKEDIVDRQLRVFSSRVIMAYNSGLDMKNFLDMLNLFFEDSRYSGVRISVYKSSDLGKGLGPTYSMGAPITEEYVAENFEENPSSVGDGTMKDFSGKMFFFKTTKSNDGDVLVYTAMPNTKGLTDGLAATDAAFWIILFGLLALSALFAFMITTSITRNIRVLRDFASAAASKKKEVDLDLLHFPHNELGDISREIAQLYIDRTEALEKSQREHEVAIHAIQERSRLKRQMTNNINHELKTPVGVIKGYLDTVLSSDDMDEKTKTYFLRRAQDNVDRLCNLLNDVSTMTRLEEGSGNIPITDVDFHELVFSIDNDFATSGMTGDMKFQYDVPLDCHVKGNTNLLTSAISNLIKNAVLHSHGTKMGIRIVAQSDKYYTFAFWDDGQGVDPSAIPHLFERFFRVDTGRSRKTGGTGLGLPIVKSIIESLGGSMSVHNRAVGGLEFMFTLRKSL